MPKEANMCKINITEGKIKRRQELEKQGKWLISNVVLGNSSPWSMYGHLPFHILWSGYDL